MLISTQNRLKKRILYSARCGMMLDKPLKEHIEKERTLASDCDIKESSELERKV